MPEESIWNRKLFEIPKGFKAVGHLICICWFSLYWVVSEWMVLKSYSHFGLVTEHTSIPGDLVFFVTQVSAAVGLWSIYCLSSKRFEAVRHIALMISGISVFSWMFIGRPQKFLRVNVEDYASGYPLIFGFSSFLTALCFTIVMLITFRPTMFQPQEQSQEDTQ